MGLVTKWPKLTPTPKILSFDRSVGEISFDVADLIIFPTSALEGLEQMIPHYQITWFKDAGELV